MIHCICALSLNCCSVCRAKIIDLLQEFDTCFAIDRVSQDYPFDGGYAKFHTPLCTYCETCFHFCRFCHKVQSCTPPTRNKHWSDIPQSESRSFGEEQAYQCTLREFQMRELQNSRESARVFSL